MTLVYFSILLLQKLFFKVANPLKIDLPAVERILSVASHGASAWASAFRVDARLSDESEQSYFLKVNKNLRPFH